MCYLETRAVGVPGTEILRVLGSNTCSWTIGASERDGDRNLGWVKEEKAWNERRRKEGGGMGGRRGRRGGMRWEGRVEGGGER